MSPYLVLETPHLALLPSLRAAPREDESQCCTYGGLRSSRAAPVDGDDARAEWQLFKIHKKKNFLSRHSEIMLHLEAGFCGKTSPRESSVTSAQRQVSRVLAGSRQHHVSHAV